MGKTSVEKKNAWNSKNYDSVLFSIRKGEKDRLKQAAAAQGVSVSRFVITCINSRYPGLLSVLDDESKKRKGVGNDAGEQENETDLSDGGGSPNGG